MVTTNLVLDKAVVLLALSLREAVSAKPKAADKGKEAMKPLMVLVLHQ
jgi:hypothetical protein